jgi:hypothetical protein
VVERKTYFTIALLLTILDAVVVVRYGGSIWTAWSGVVWIRLRMLLLAALSATSLANVWAQAIYGLDRARHGKRSALALSLAANQREPQGEGDV